VRSNLILSELKDVPEVIVNPTKNRRTNETSTVEVERYEVAYLGAILCLDKLVQVAPGLKRADALRVYEPMRWGPFCDQSTPEHRYSVKT